MVDRHLDPDAAEPDGPGGVAVDHETRGARSPQRYAAELPAPVSRRAFRREVPAPHLGMGFQLHQPGALGPPVEGVEKRGQVARQLGIVLQEQRRGAGAVEKPVERADVAEKGRLRAAPHLEKRPLEIQPSPQLVVRDGPGVDRRDALGFQAQPLQAPGYRLPPVGAAVEIDDVDGDRLPRSRTSRAGPLRFKRRHGPTVFRSSMQSPRLQSSAPEEPGGGADPAHARFPKNGAAEAAP